MSKSEFLSHLRQALSGMAPREIDDIIADYSAHFDEALVAGRSEQQVSEALGGPSSRRDDVPGARAAITAVGGVLARLLDLEG